MAAWSLHDDVVPDSEERHERTPHRVCAYLASVVEGFAGAQGASRWQARHRVGWDATDVRDLPRGGKI